MKTQHKQENRTRTDTDHMKEAYRWIASILCGGGEFDCRGNKPVVLRTNARFQDLHPTTQNYVMEVISGRTKNWAVDYDEYAIEIETENGSAIGISGVRLLCRQRIRDAFHIDLGTPAASSILASRLNGASALIMQDCTPAKRKALDTILRQTRSDRLPPLIYGIETGRLKDDYKNLLAGSWWVKLDKNTTCRSLVHRALLCAFMAKTLRPSALTETKLADLQKASGKTAWNRSGPSSTTPDTGGRKSRPGPPTEKQLTYARALAAEQKIILDPETAGSAALCAEFITRHQSAKRPATEKQIALIEKILVELPFLRDTLEDSWQKDQAQARRWLDLILPHTRRWRQAISGKTKETRASEPWNIIHNALEDIEKEVKELTGIEIKITFDLFSRRAD